MCESERRREEERVINIRRIITLNFTIWKNWCKIVPIGWSSLQSRLSYGRKSIHTITVIQFPNISNFINFCVLYWKKSSLQFMFPTCSAILAIIVYLHYIKKFYLKFFFYYSHYWYSMHNRAWNVCSKATQRYQTFEKHKLIKKVFLF